MSQVTSPIILDSTGRSIASGLAGLATAISSRPAPAEDTPIMDGVGDVGTSLKYAREDHVHPTDTSKADKLTGVFYGVCSTAAATQDKEVTISGITALETGLNIRVRFSSGQSYNGTPTLNLNSLGAKNIARYGSTGATQYEWSSGEVLDLVYDGTNWIVVNEGHATTSYWGVTRLSSSHTSTSTDRAATPSAVKAAYDLADSKQDAITTGTMSLSTTWSGSGPYTQTATITGVTLTANSKVDIQLTAAQTADLIDDGVIALIPENNAGTVTVTALGAAPSSALTLQITVTEVA